MPATAPQQAVQLKQTYRPKHKLECFFTGGAARVTRDGKLVVCACSEEVKVGETGGGGAFTPNKGLHTHTANPIRRGVPL